MAPRSRIIIDTDPGVDDILAMLLAFASKPEELDILLISVTFGNIDVQNCLRNVFSLFHMIEQEQEWRRRNNRADGFDTLKTTRPIVAVGAEEPLADQLMMADFFHGKDGLGDIHSSHPHLTPSDAWKSLFNQSPPSPESPSETLAASEIATTTKSHSSFVPSDLPAHKEMLRTLADNDPDSITIVAIGPLTNLALAAAEDPETFLKVKEVVIMGGAIDVPGNITPLAEFNTHSDAYAFARLLALTSPTPTSTMPPAPPDTSPNPNHSAPPPFLRPYPAHLSRQLTLTLLPLDITTTHVLLESAFEGTVKPLLEAGSPLAEWVDAFLRPTWQRSKKAGSEGLALHDPLAVWYAITSPLYPHVSSSSGSSNTNQPTDDSSNGPGWTISENEDIRVEAAGQWTRGACIIDRRGLEKVRRDPDVSESGDAGGWLDAVKGNRVRRAIRSPGENGEKEFAGEMLRRIFGV